MAITINIYYTGINGNARKFAEEMTARGIVNDIRAEEGNLRYEYFFPMNNEETVLLIDSWIDQHAIDIHHSSPTTWHLSRLFYGYFSYLLYHYYQKKQPQKREYQVYWYGFGTF